MHPSMLLSFYLFVVIERLRSLQWILVIIIIVVHLGHLGFLSLNS